MDRLIKTLFYGTNGAFAWGDNLGKIVLTALMSMIPAFEGRYALAVAQGMGMPAIPAFLIAFVCSTLPMPFIFLLLRPVLDWLYRLPIGFLRKFAAWVDRRVEKKKQDVDKKGLLGLFLFVAVPLPGTGVWTGTAIATVLKMNRKHAAPVIILGNLTACAVMTTVSYLGLHLFG